MPGHSSRRDLARRVSDLIERPAPRSDSTARPHVLGITGPPGAGKSTLVDRLIRELRNKGKRPGVIVVDPSSPVTGGALLGDRIRMQDHASDEGVFIRSVANRGHLGGLAAGIEGVLDLLAAEGFAPLVIETVGVGQSEVEVAAVADTVVVVLHPGWGDDVQTEKAGLLEIAHIVFVNKSDQGGGEGMAGKLAGSLPVPVLIGSALTGEGIDDLSVAIDNHRAQTSPRSEPNSA